MLIVVACCCSSACVSPLSVHGAETLSTLQYANRARNIQNKVEKNVESVDASGSPRGTSSPRSGKRLQRTASEIEIHLLQEQICYLKQQLDQANAAAAAAAVVGTNIPSLSTLASSLLAKTSSDESCTAECVALADGASAPTESLDGALPVVKVSRIKPPSRSRTPLSPKCKANKKSMARAAAAASVSACKDAASAVDEALEPSSDAGNTVVAPVQVAPLVHAIESVASQCTLEYVCSPAAALDAPEDAMELHAAPQDVEERSVDSRERLSDDELKSDQLEDKAQHPSSNALVECTTLHALQRPEDVDLQASSNTDGDLEQVNGDATPVEEKREMRSDGSESSSDAEVGQERFDPPTNDVTLVESIALHAMQQPEDGDRQASNDVDGKLEQAHGGETSEDEKEELRSDDLEARASNDAEVDQETFDSQTNDDAVADSDPVAMTSLSSVTDPIETSVGSDEDESSNSDERLLPTEPSAESLLNGTLLDIAVDSDSRDVTLDSESFAAPAASCKSLDQASEADTVAAHGGSVAPADVVYPALPSDDELLEDNDCSDPVVFVTRLDTSAAVATESVIDSPSAQADQEWLNDGGEDAMDDYVFGPADPDISIESRAVAFVDLVTSSTVDSVAFVASPTYATADANNREDDNDDEASNNQDAPDDTITKCCDCKSKQERRQQDNNNDDVDPADDAPEVTEPDFVLQRCDSLLLSPRARRHGRLLSPQKHAVRPMSLFAFDDSWNALQHSQPSSLSKLASLIKVRPEHACI